jgi:large subunit ribosomal protein L3
MLKKGILGKKLGMTQIFTKEGLKIPVSVIEVSPNVVLEVKNLDKDGYTSIRLGYDDQLDRRLSNWKKEDQTLTEYLAKFSKTKTSEDKEAKREFNRIKSRVRRPDLGQYKKANTNPKKFVKEIRFKNVEETDYKVGDLVKIEDVFKIGDPVDVTGVSKGKGFQGVIKRHNYHIIYKTHGTHESFRRGGSIGMGTDPGRVLKGRPMAGHMGNKNVTVQNLKVVDILVDIDVDGDKPKKNLLLVQGGIPGTRNGYVTIRFAMKKRVYV